MPSFQKIRLKGERHNDIFLSLQKRSFPEEALHASDNLRETIRYDVLVSSYFPRAKRTKAVGGNHDETNQR